MYAVYFYIELVKLDGKKTGKLTFIITYFLNLLFSICIFIKFPQVYKLFSGYGNICHMFHKSKQSWFSYGFPLFQVKTSSNLQPIFSKLSTMKAAFYTHFYFVPLPMPYWIISQLFLVIQKRNFSQICIILFKFQIKQLP